MVKVAQQALPGNPESLIWNSFLPHSSGRLTPRRWRPRACATAAMGAKSKVQHGTSLGGGRAERSGPALRGITKLMLGSPAHAAGLIPFFDHIVALDDITLGPELEWFLKYCKDRIGKVGGRCMAIPTVKCSTVNALHCLPMQSSHAGRAKVDALLGRCRCAKKIREVGKSVPIIVLLPQLPVVRTNFDHCCADSLRQTVGRAAAGHQGGRVQLPDAHAPGLQRVPERLVGHRRRPRATRLHAAVGGRQPRPPRRPPRVPGRA